MDTTPLITRKIPSSGEALPIVGLGTWQAFDIAPGGEDWAQAREALNAFAERGGKVVDSSPMYGRAEAAIGALRPEYRACILLRHVEGRPYEEIADILDLPLGTVKTYIHRARNELRELLGHLRE